MSYKTRASALVFYKYFSSKNQSLSLKNEVYAFPRKQGFPARSWTVGETEQNEN